MKIYKSDVASFTKSPTARMGIAFVKEREALFLTRYFDDCIFRIKDVCYVANDMYPEFWTHKKLN